LDLIDTYQNGKYNNSSLRKGKEGKVLKIKQILLEVSFENGFPIFHKLYDGNISNINIFEYLIRKLAQGGINLIFMDRMYHSESNVVDMNTFIVFNFQYRKFTSSKNGKNAVV